MPKWPSVASTFLLAGLSTGAAQQPCARCHASEVTAFENSPMGRSISPPTVFTEGRIVHKLSGSTLTVSKDGPVLEHSLDRHGVTTKYPVAYSVGAGIVGYSYIVRLGQYLYQSPISYYTQTKGWDLTPGYETDPNLDFTHQISSGCLFCHTGSVNLVKGTVNRFSDPPFTSISCERCHGPSAAHLSNPVPGSIVNPAKLTAARRDSVCEQCHLEGDARILNPGRDWWDFQSGQATESVFATYLKTSDPDHLRAVSQSELLARSQCATQSGGRLWCGTCHNPHGDPQNRAQEIQKVCLSCHAAIFKAGAHQPVEECTSCHMPRLRPTNVAHSAVTDHSIPRVPHQSRTAEGPELKAWREPPDPVLARRDLGLAYFDLATASRAAPDLQHAYQLLSQLPSSARQNDPPVEAGLASILLAQDQVKLAVQLFRNAVIQQPSDARYAYCLGAALERAGDFREAVNQLRRSIALDPSQPDAYLELAQFYKKTGHEAESLDALRDYQRFRSVN